MTGVYPSSRVVLAEVGVGRLSGATVMEAAQVVVN